MDDSTEGVTLYAGFIFGLLDNYTASRDTFAAPVFEMAAGLDPNDPTALVPIQLYNDMCSWIETELGPGSLQRAGTAIGNRAYDQMVADASLSSNPGPLEMMEQLAQVASVMIQDPRGRGWEIREAGEGRIVMRRTQSFNCILQEGLLQSLIKRCGVALAIVNHSSCVRKGAEFCDYEVTWLATGQS